MRTAKFLAEKIVRLLHEATAGTAVPEVCRRHGITATTFYRWRQKYGGLQVERDEAAQSARGGESATQEARGRALARQRDAQRRGGAQMVTATQRRQVVTHPLAAFRVSARRACRLVGLSRSRWRGPTPRFRLVADEIGDARGRLAWQPWKGHWGRDLPHTAMSFRPQRTRLLYAGGGEIVMVPSLSDSVPLGARWNTWLFVSTTRPLNAPGPPTMVPTR
jgi:transposase-like protein